MGRCPPPIRIPHSCFVRIARWCAHHRWQTFVGWVALVVAVSVLGSTVGTAKIDDFRLPGTESQRAYDVLAEHSPQRNGLVDQLVYVARDGTLKDPALRARIDRSRERVQKDPIVVAVASPRLTPDARIGVVDITYQEDFETLDPDDFQRVQDAAFTARGAGLQVEHGGQGAQFARFGSQEQGATEFIGFFAAFFVLLVMFGSLIAAGIPLLTAAFAIGATFGLVPAISQFVDTPDFAGQLAALIGIGVGIDYALIVVTRYRAEHARGLDREGALLLAMDTAGRTVFFAGCTVIIALLGLLLLGLSFRHGAAVAAAIAVALIMLLSLAIPALHMRLGTSDAGLDPPDTTTRQAYDLIAEGFGAGTSGSFLLAVDLPRKGDGTAARRLADVVARDPDVAQVVPPQLSQDGESATIVAFPKSGPREEETTRLLERLRGEVLPPVARETGAEVFVGGQVASQEDFTAVIADKLPLFVGMVVLLSALLLMAVFRSVFIPIKAALMNPLSIGAALGFITLVFQDGFLTDVLGVGTGPIESFVPVMTFAIVFGLSMDYEMFLMSRVREEWLRTGDASLAVRNGVATTGRVITAAALIMIVVFVSFSLVPERVIKEFGLGLAMAVLLDALVIRCLLVPALMQVVGPKAWWSPSWLERRMPHLATERE